MRGVWQLLFFVTIFFTLPCVADHPVTQVSKVILWGHKLHTHTHSYIHWGFSRAFKHLGYETYWLDARDDIRAFDFKNALFITEGQVDRGIPIRDDCYYIIHNCVAKKYQHLLDNGRAIILQVYTHDCLTRQEPALSLCFHYNIPQSTIYMPWATDLLPHEIDAIKENIALPNAKKNHATFIGSIMGGHFGNQPQINAFKRAIKQSNIEFEHGGVNNKSMESNITMVQQALLAPAIQGGWQCKQGYIPCRIFKNISYGAMGITNSKTVYDLFEGTIVYNDDSYRLGVEAVNRIRTWSVKDQYALMDIVRDKHTYLNRISLLFTFFEMVESYKKGVL